ncbi:MAG: hypothetical protein Tsb0034_25640 [Ekhidna sp.]
MVALISVGVFSQNTKECGTSFTKKDWKAYKDLKRNIRQRARLAEPLAPSPIKIALKAHIVRPDNGVGGLSEVELNDAIEVLNNIYSLTNMEFFLFGDINFIDDSRYYDFDSDDEGELTSVHDVENVINVYFFNSADQGTLCGYAYFPPTGIDHIVVVNDCVTNGSTFAHELGHYFFLPHTHGNSNGELTDELVNGSNCEDAGDGICDTPADPQLGFRNVTAGCAFSGTADYTIGSGELAVDANGDTFNPDPRNLMSYSRKQCRDQFSSGQAEVIVNAYNDYKTYLLSRNYVADFDVGSFDVCGGESVTFTDASVNAVSYSWIFEGGTPASSSEASPTVLYSTPGTYDVSLTITTAEGNEDTHVFNDLIVRDALLAGSTTFSGSFEEVTLKERILDEDRELTWERTQVASSDGSASMMLNFFDYESEGEEDFLIMPLVEASDDRRFILSFDYAYARYSDDYFDGLEIVYREPCTSTWTTIWSKEGSELATAPDHTGFFVPEEQEWKSDYVVIDFPENLEQLEVAFKGVNGWGNNLYIDNYEVSLDDDFAVETIASPASCKDIENGSIVVNVSGKTSYQYSLDGESYSFTSSFIGLLPDQYSIFVKNALEEVKTMDVSVGFENEYPEQPEIVSSAEGLSLARPAEEGQTITWYLNGLLQIGENEATLENPQRGTYTVELSNGSCGSMSEPFLVLSAPELEEALALYPNPTSGIIRLSAPFDINSRKGFVEVTDLTGKLHKRHPLEEILFVNELKSGLYLLQIHMDNQIITKRFLKE